MEVGILECYPLCLYASDKKYPFAAKRRCTAGVSTLVIGADGNIRACTHSEEVFGNIKDGGIKKAWSAMKTWRDGSRLSKKCLSCDYVIECSGGCRVDAKYINGSESSMDPYASVDRVQEINYKGADSFGLVNVYEKMAVSNIKTRKERFGYLCADKMKASSPVLLTKDTYELVESLIGKVFTAADISAKIKVDISMAQEIGGLLVRDGVFNKIV